MERAAWKKARLKTATRDDFQLIKQDMGCGEIMWAASLYGCTDIAWFVRKADAQLFISAWPVKEK